MAKKKNLTVNQLFEKILVEHVATSELRYVYRKQFKSAIEKQNNKHHIIGYKTGIAYINDMEFDRENIMKD